MYPPEEEGVVPRPESEGKGSEGIQEAAGEVRAELAVELAVELAAELAGNQDVPELAGKAVIPGPVTGERRPWTNGPRFFVYLLIIFYEYIKK